MVNKKHIEMYLKMADLVAQMSHAQRLKVGSIAVKNDNIIGFGWNGTPSGWDNNCEDVLPDGTLKTKPIVLHSEMNTLMKVARSTESSDGSVLFCTHAPCLDCGKAIFQAGVRQVYYRHQYRSDDGLQFLAESGVAITRHTTNNS